MNAVARLNASLKDEYAIERELGAGAMATVFLAQDLRHERHVALKVLNLGLGSDIAIQRFLSEIRVTASLHHPHILPLFDSGEAAGFLYYAMPYVEGHTLRHYMRKRAPLPVDEAMRIAADVASALDYAHEQGVLHRDIKPENIMLHDDGAMLMDFGIALAAQRAGGSRITQTGVSLGTPGYMSPEQAQGSKHIDARADIYSLGCVVYEMLSGEVPFDGATAQIMLARVAREDPKPIRMRRPEVPAAIDDAVLRALSRKRSRRFRRASEFASALQTTDAGTARSNALRTLRVWQAVAIGAGLVAVAAVWFALR